MGNEGCTRGMPRSFKKGTYTTTKGKVKNDEPLISRNENIKHIECSSKTPREVKHLSTSRKIDQPTPDVDAIETGPNLTFHNKSLKENNEPWWNPGPEKVKALYSLFFKSLRKESEYIESN